MKRLTITLDEETATWLRMYAAASNASVSRIVRAMVAQQMNADRDYMQAMLRYLAKAPVPLKVHGSQYVSRDEIHDRGRHR